MDGYPWGREDEELLAFHKKMIEIRKRYGVLRDGSWRFIYAADGVAAVARFSDSERIIAVFNSNDKRKTVMLPLWLSGADTEGMAATILKSGLKGFKTGGKIYRIQSGCVNLTVDAFGCVILKSE